MFGIKSFFKALGIIPDPDAFTFRIAPLIVAGLISAAAKGAQKVGDMKAGKDARSAEQIRLDEANELSGEQYDERMKLINDMIGPGGQYSNLLTDPIESTQDSTYWGSSSTKPTFTEEGQAGIAGMLEGAMSEQGRAESLPEFAGLEEGMARDFGQQMSGLKTALGNRAAGRGAAPLDTELEGVLAGRGITADYLGRKQAVPGMKEQARMQKSGIANMLFSQLAGLGRGSKTRQRGGQTTKSRQGQGASGLLGYLNALPEKQIFV